MSTKGTLESLESKRPHASADAKAMSDDPKARQCKDYALQWIKQNGLKNVLSILELPGPPAWAPLKDFASYAENYKKHLTEKVNHNFVAEKMQPFLKGQPPMKYVSLGAGLHGGYGVGTAGFEGGSIWKFNDFGYIPMRNPYSDYMVEWTTFGISGVDIGASADILACSMWFVDADVIEGACNGVTFTAEFFAGSSVTLYWTGEWKGAQGSSHPIGIGMVCCVGLEFGVGAFYNASFTQFFNKRS
jgi:hypothetical protein